MPSQQEHFCFFILLVVLVKFFGADKNTFESCERYTSFGYGYRDLFQFNKDTNFTPDLVFYLEFFVKTSSDAHVLLKSSYEGEDTTPEGYEIVIGGGSNSFSQIRHLNKEVKNTIITKKTENYLSGIEYRKFWISMDHSGILSVGRNDDAFLVWRFYNALPIKYFSFGSWTQVKADWRFGCKSQTGSGVIEDSTNVSPLRKLKHDLFTLYDPNVLPVEASQTLEVKVNFQINQVTLNEKRGELTMHGTGDLKWTDPKVRWKPEDYYGIDTIYVPPFQIWTPSVRVLNTLVADNYPLFDLTVSGVLVKSDGSVFWRPPFKSVSVCVVDLKYWPTDYHNCSVVVGFFMEPSNLILTVMDEYNIHTGDKVGSEWEIVEISPFNSEEEFGENYGILYVELKRLQGTQPLLYSIPFFVAITMTSVAFWVPLQSSMKFHLCSGSLIILVMTLLLMGINLPAITASVPLIIQQYSWTIVVNSLPVILFCVLKNIQSTISIPQPISRLLNHEFVNELFCLPQQLGGLYSNLNDEENKISKDRLDTLRLLTIIERFFFFAYIILIFLLNFIVLI